MTTRTSSIIACLAAVALTAGTALNAQGNTEAGTRGGPGQAQQGGPGAPPPGPNPPRELKQGPQPPQGSSQNPADPNGQPEGYTIQQAASWKAQLDTYAFLGLAFLTGTFGADTFMPPGKVADYFGLEYMRDIDAAEAGHNNMFLTNICANVLAVLDDTQKGLLKDLAVREEAKLLSPRL